MVNFLSDHFLRNQDSKSRDDVQAEGGSDSYVSAPVSEKVKTDNRLAVITMNIATALAVAVMFIIK